MRPIKIEQRIEPSYCLQITTIDLIREPWFHDIKNYLKDQTLSYMVSKNDQRALRRLATQFVIHGGTSCKKSPHHVLLRCVDEFEASAIIDDIHGGECGPHMNGLMLAKKIL